MQLISPGQSQLLVHVWTTAVMRSESGDLGKSKLGIDEQVIVE